MPVLIGLNRGFLLVGRDLRGNSYDFPRDFSRVERRTRIVIAIAGLMMVVEITTGLLSHSMALLADGWHMSTHVTAFLITAVAYHFTWRYASDERSSLGTGKIGENSQPLCQLLLMSRKRVTHIANCCATIRSWSTSRLRPSIAGQITSRWHVLTAREHSRDVGRLLAGGGIRP
ncbi:MAG TPA: cation transporter [Chthoniobacterales bacterium]